MVHARYPFAVISQLEKENEVLLGQSIYAVTGALDYIEVFPNGYAEPAEAVAAAGGEQHDAVAHMRVADRFVWLGETEIKALIRALDLTLRENQGKGE